MNDTLIKGYEERNGKIPPRKNLPLLPEPPNGDHCGVFETGSVVIVDIDDYDHKTGEIEDPVRDHPRSEAVVQYLDSRKIRYNGIRTEHGVHLEFRYPSGYEISGNKNNWFCALGVKIEVKVTKPVELIVVNGVRRQCFKGSIGSPDIDELPPALYPLQKNRDKPFTMDFSAGDRNNQLSSYAFYLTQKGISAEDAADIIRGLNDYVLEDPLPDEEIDLILRAETLEKMAKNARIQKDKALSHADVGQEVIDHFGIVTVQDQIFRYEGGLFVETDENMIGSYIRRCHPAIKSSLKNEAIDFIKDMTYRQSMKEAPDLINVKNGFLKVGEDDAVDLIPHSKDLVSFRQFNAVYDPGAVSEVLNETLLKFFDGDQDQILLFKQMLGYLLCNHVEYQKCFFFIGSPSSGKSQILNMVTVFCGRENVSNLTLKEFDDRFRPASLVGKTVNINSDLENVRIPASGQFKSLVTGDAITIERKFGKPFSYANTAKLIFASNQYPDFSRDAEGVHRRLIIFPCNHTFKKTDPDYNPKIGHDLTTEECLSALLNMALEGFLSLKGNKGFMTTKATEEAANAFKCENNNVFAWLKESDHDAEYLLREPIRCSNAGSYMEYLAYCAGCGEEAKEQRDFTKTICSEFGFTTERKRVKGTAERSRFFVKK